VMGWIGIAQGSDFVGNNSLLSVWYP
jgi:hypothetical protein